MSIVLLVLMIGSGITFLLSVFRAMRFAQRHKEQLDGVIERSSWWLRLFVRNGYGNAMEGERRRLALAWIIAGVCFFACAALLLLTAPPMPVEETGKGPGVYSDGFHVVRYNPY